jgi:hypothetical protein
MSQDIAISDHVRLSLPQEICTRGGSRKSALLYLVD